MKQIRFAMILLVFTLLLAGTAQAQSELAVNTAQVQLWPEYDQPAMLVIYTLELAADQPLPADVTVRIPASVGEPMAVAVLEDDGGLVTRQYTRTVDGDWAEITLETDYPVVQVEYYDDALNQAEPQRSYTFTWEADFPVDNFVFSVKEPVNAVDFTTLPDLGAGVTAADGLLTYSASFGSLAANQSFQFSLGYTKNDTTLATESFLGGGSTTTEETIGGLPLWGWVLVGVGALILIGGGTYYITSQRKTSVSTYRSRKQRTSSNRAASGSVFCHECGASASASDKFCRECGTKLRK